MGADERVLVRLASDPVIHRMLWQTTFRPSKTFHMQLPTSVPALERWMHAPGAGACEHSNVRPFRFGAGWRPEATNPLGGSGWYAKTPNYPVLH